MEEQERITEELQKKADRLSEGLSCSTVHIERNISSHSSYEFPYCVVDERGIVKKRCITLEKAKGERDRLNNGKAR